MILILVLAGFCGMMAPWLGFMVLFIGGMFLAGITAGILGLVITVMVILVIMSVSS